MVGPLEPVQALEQRLAARGLQAGDEHVGMVREAAALATPPPGGIEVRAVADASGLDRWFEVIGRAFGDRPALTDAERALFLAACTGPTARVCRVVAHDRATGEPLSAGGISLFPDVGFGFLWAGGTVLEARGRGAYRAVLAARAAFARDRGYERVGLYARVGTSAPIVARLGFRRGGSMRYWEWEPDGEPASKAAAARGR